MNVTSHLKELLYELAFVVDSLSVDDDSHTLAHRKVEMNEYIYTIHTLVNKALPDVEARTGPMCTAANAWQVFCADTSMEGNARLPLRDVRAGTVGLQGPCDGGEGDIPRGV